MMATKHTYSKVTSNGVALHILETDASNIKMVNLKKAYAGIHPSPYFGCNAGFFDNTTATNYDTYNIAYSDGAACGPTPAGTRNTCGYGIIAYVSGILTTIRATDLAYALENVGAATWIQGGGMMKFGHRDWESQWEFPHAPSTTSGGWTAMVANRDTKKVYLIVKQDETKKKLSDFRKAIMDHFGISSTDKSTQYLGLMLDGGGSSTLKAKNSAGTTVGPITPRALCQIIALRDAN